MLKADCVNLHTRLLRSQRLAPDDSTRITTWSNTLFESVLSWKILAALPAHTPLRRVGCLRRPTGSTAYAHDAFESQNTPIELFELPAELPYDGTEMSTHLVHGGWLVAPAALSGCSRGCRILLGLEFLHAGLCSTFPELHGCGLWRNRNNLGMGSEIVNRRNCALHSVVPKIRICPVILLVTTWWRNRNTPVWL
jgi:hypothetical protein